MMDKLYPTSQPFHSYQPQHNGFQVKLQMPANQGFFRSGREYEEKLHIQPLLHEKDSVTLHLLIQANKSSLMKFLLKVGYNINTTDVEKRTPLHAAVKEKDVEIAQRLIQAGADIDATDINGTSPLSLAMEMRNFELMSMLVANQADTRSLGLERIRTVFGLRSSDSLEIYESRQDGTRIMRQLPREFSWTTDMVFDTARFSMNLLKLTDKVPGLEELGLNHLLNFKREKSVPFNLRVEQLTETTPEGSVWIYFLQISLPAAGRDFETYVCWNAVSHTDQDGLVTWKTTASISGLTKIWLPAKGIELFQSLMSEIQRRWSSIIRSTMSTANSQNMVTEARKFAVDYCKRHDEATSLDAILKQIEAFDHDVGDYIDQLDRLSQSLIELEFNFVSIKEARQSVKMARSLKRLSWITFIFLPLTFVALEDIAEKAVASFTRKKNMENQRRNFKY
ncbi:putative ankyrin repeat protein [Colletotrichum sp. SAR 10_86]|nr:putative ankyrin repeat protein [Colletotrichum sp. SAR 10_86]